MTVTQSSSEASLAEVLGARAKRTPMDRLLIDLVGGGLVMLVAVWARPSGWVVLAAAAGCLLAYGAWAIAERKLLAVPWPESVPHEQVWRAVRGGAAVVGIAAFVLLLFAAMGLALGSIVS